MHIFTRTRTVGLLASLSIGIIAWLISRDPLGALAVGILGEVVALLIEMRTSISEELSGAKEEINRELDVVKGELDDFKRADQLRAGLPGASDGSPDLLSYVSDYLAVITKDDNDLFRDFATDRIILAGEEMRDLANGRMIVGADVVSTLGSKILSNLEKGGFATALGDLYDFWLPQNRSSSTDERAPGAVETPDPSDPKDQGGTTSDEAKRNYQRQSIKVVQRKLELMRVFLLNDENTELLPEFFQLIEDQASEGVVVKVAYLSKIPAYLQKDFAIWDEKIVAHIHWGVATVKGPGGDKIETAIMTGATYCTSQGELIKARAHRAELVKLSHFWHEVRDNHLRR